MGEKRKNRRIEDIILEEKSEVKKRLLLFILWRRKNVPGIHSEYGMQAFSKDINQGSTWLSNFHSEVLKPKYINAIKMRFTELNMDWLLTGEGEMILPRERHVLQIGCNTKVHTGDGSPVNIGGEQVVETPVPIVDDSKDAMIARMQNEIEYLRGQIEKLQERNDKLMDKLGL